MSFRFKPFGLAAFALICSALPAFSQYGTLRGSIKGPEGKGVAGAVVAFDRTDAEGTVNGIKFHSEVKSDKKGDYVNSLLPATYIITVIVDGQPIDRAAFPIQEGINPAQDFHLKATGKPAAAGPTASKGGSRADQDNAAKEREAQLKKEQEQSKTTKEAQQANDKAAKEREAQLAKNKELNDSFGAGKAALENKQWDEAITQLTKASEIGPTQTAVWASLAEAYMNSAKAAKGADAAPIFGKSYAAFDKLIALKPDDAGSYNNYALALAAGKRLDDAKVKLAKAVELDPPGAGKYHYNLGALLMNSNQTDGAIDEFKKAIDANPNYAEAYYYYGSTLAGKTTLDQATGKMVPLPGTVEALQKYLTLKPEGPKAESARVLIAALGSSVSVNYKDPNAPKTTKTTKKTGK